MRLRFSVRIRKTGERGKGPREISVQIKIPRSKTSERWEGFYMKCLKRKRNGMRKSIDDLT